MFNLLSPFKLYASVGVIILLLSIVGIGTYKYNHALSRASIAEGALTTYKSAQVALANKQIADNAVMYATAHSKVILADNLSTSKLTELHLDRQTETNNLKALYEAKLNNLKRGMVHSVQSSATDSTSALSNCSSNTETAPTGESVSDRAYTTLESACKITTLDYNDLRAWADTACEIVECK